MRALRDFEAYWKTACQAMGGTVEDGSSICLHGPAGGPPTNGILRVGDLDLAAEIDTWKKQGAPFSVIVSDDKHRDVALAAGLQESSVFVLVEGPVTDLGEPQHPMGSDVEAFVDVQMVAHDIPEFVRGVVINGWSKNVADGVMQLFVAGEEPAGCAALFTGGGNAGLYAFGVLPQHRRKGIAKSLAAACMKAAKQQGLQHVVAATTPDGFALARALGATDGVKIHQFQWFPAGPPPN